MALSNLEGCTAGGLDAGRGSGTRILAFKGSILLGTNVTGTCVHKVDMDGTVTNTNAGSATHALTVTYGHGLTLETPVLTDDAEDTIANVFKLTFGVASTTAVTASTNELNIIAAVCNMGHYDEEGGTDLAHPLPANVESCNGNQITIRVGEVQVHATEVVIAATDTLYFNVIALAIPA